jgi:hypothetical protein
VNKSIVEHIERSKRTGRGRISIPNCPGIEIPGMPNILENTLEANDDNEGGEREINLDEINFEKNDEKIFTINHQISHDLVANSR